VLWCGVKWSSVVWCCMVWCHTTPQWNVYSSGLFETFELKKKIFSSFLSKNPHDFSALKNSMKNIDKNEL